MCKATLSRESMEREGRYCVFMWGCSSRESVELAKHYSTPTQDFPVQKVQIVGHCSTHIWGIRLKEAQS